MKQRVIHNMMVISIVCCISLLSLSVYAASGDLLLVVSPLSGLIAGEQQAADAVTRMLREALVETAGEYGCTECVVADNSENAGNGQFVISARGEYVVHNGDDTGTQQREYIITVRLYEEDGRLLRTVLSSWYGDDDLNAEIRSVAAEIITCVCSYYRDQTEQMSAVRHARRDDSLSDDASGTVLHPAVSLGAVKPMGDFAGIADFGLSADCALSVDTFTPAFAGSKPVSMRISGRYIWYLPAKKSIAHVHSFHIAGSMGYLFMLNNSFMITPRAGIGMQFAAMKYDGRDNASYPYQYETKRYYQPLVTAAVSFAYPIHAFRIFVEPALLLFKDGSERGLYASVHCGVSRGFSTGDYGGSR